MRNRANALSAVLSRGTALTSRASPAEVAGEKETENG